MMMLKKFPIIIVALIAASLPVPGQGGDLSGNCSFAAGFLSADDDFADAFDMDERFEAGVILDAKKESWPVSLAVEYFLSYGHSDITDNAYGLQEGRDVDIFCSEMYLGIKKTLDFYDFIKPYVAGGVYSVNMYADISYDDEYDGGLGGWFGAGTYIKISEDWHLNLEWRRAKAKVDLFGHSLDAGGDHFDISLGYHFPVLH